jgi:5-(carboxyamino)imidazole ribonucleotide synthase
MPLLEKLARSNLTLGIIAGGQLGKMLIQKASEWSIKTKILDPDETCPSRAVADEYVQGDYLDFDTVYNFGKGVDVLTFELENINIEALKKLKQEGVLIAPDPEILECIQDKGLQKNWYQSHQIPTSDFEIYPSKESIVSAIEEKKITFPFVQKLRTGGFDGRGVSVINSPENVSLLLDGPSVIEEKIEMTKEISVQVARNKNGEMKCFPSTEMTFDPESNLVDFLICPAKISAKIEKEAQKIAKEIVEKMDFEGILAVEFFLTPSGEILVNECAPRPHNSGHHTIESLVTSQFEQHLRAVLNLPLGSTDIVAPAVMINIVGEDGHTGPVVYKGLEKILAEEKVFVHLYGKKITKPFRKMGHITVLGESLEDAAQKAEKIKHSFSVQS